jgi:hypothetical protein
MGFFSWLMQRIDKPADQSLLLGSRTRGSETMITADSPEQEEAAAAGVRRDRARRRWRWLSLGGRGPF